MDKVAVGGGFNGPKVVQCKYESKELEYGHKGV